MVRQKSEAQKNEDRNTAIRPSISMYAVTLEVKPIRLKITSP